MTTISRHVTVDANSDRVWAALADFGNIAVFNPSVKRSHLTSTTTEGAGISRECQLAPAGTVQETVTAWTEGESMTVEITEFKNVPAMRSGVADIRIEPKGAQTDVSMALTYEVGLGALGAGMNSMMMKRQFEKGVTGLLAGLKHHLETGESVERRSTLPTAAVVAA